LTSNAPLSSFANGRAHPKNNSNSCFHYRTFGAVGLLLSEDAAGRFQAFGQQMRSFSMIGLLVAWRVFDPIFDSIFGLSLKVLYPTQGYGS
jgi:hypothetical protein